MGIRSFLIVFNNIDELKLFYQWKGWLANFVSEVYDDCNDSDDFSKQFQKIVMPDIYTLNKRKSGYYGDFALHLVGFKFWGRAIWGLISTDSVGVYTMGLMMNQILKSTYWARLSEIDTENYEYDQIKSEFLVNPDDKKEALEIWSKIYLNYSNKILDYPQILAGENISDQHIPFYKKKFYRKLKIKKIKIENCPIPNH